MINMMYLVLIAMLALNVSKDLLKAFVSFDEGMLLTMENSTRKNSALYSELERANGLDPIRAGAQWQKAQEIKQATSHAIAWVDSLSKALIAETEGITMDEADTIQLRYVEAQDDVDVTTNCMIGPVEDGSQGAARTLKQKLVGHYKALHQTLGKDLAQGFELRVDTSSVVEDGVKLSWEVAHFYRTPLVAAVALLSKYKSDLRNAEYEALERLYASISERDLPFDTVAAKVIAQNDYVILGDTHKAEVFVAAYSTTRDPQVDLYQGSNVNAIKVDVSNGVGQVLLPSDKTGLHSYRGEVKLLGAHGNELVFPFQHEYLVATPSVAVSPTKMNVFYRGIDNPIDVSVPGFANEQVRVSINGGNTVRNLGNGAYNVRMAANSPARVTVSIAVQTDEGLRNFGTKEFRAMRLPDPYVRLGNVTTQGQLTKQQLCAYQGLVAEYAKDFPFELSCDVVKYNVLHVQRNGTVMEYRNNGARFSEQLKALMCAARRGDRFYFEKVKARGKDGVRELSGIAITVK